MHRKSLVLLVAASAALAACAVNAENAAPPPPTLDAQGLVDARQGGMAMSVSALGAVSSGLAAKAPARSYRLAANGLADFARSLPVLFDPRTAGIEKTNASPAIWNDAAGFAARVAQYREATAALSAAVSADDAAATEAALASTKAACKACHDTYQAK